jgi:hypothetical protein
MQDLSAGRLVACGHCHVNDYSEEDLRTMSKDILCVIITWFVYVGVVR